MVKLRLIHGDGLDALWNSEGVDTVFVDPPDNISLGYDEYKDRKSADAYVYWLDSLIEICYARSKTAYISVNAKWINLAAMAVARIVPDESRWLIQGFTFGQHNEHDLANNFRPILRLRHADAPLYPDRSRVESWRMQNGDKRAATKGRVPGDVWFTDFLTYARVTGNSKQRRRWHPTQLHEGLVEDCLLMSTPEGGTVFDPCAGTGTTLRVCAANGWACTTCDVSAAYCREIASEHNLTVEESQWTGFTLAETP